MLVWNPQANEIFLVALEIPAGAERQQYLKQACHGQADLLEQVEALLAASDKAESFLESPATEVRTASEHLSTLHPDPPSLGFLSPSAKNGSLGRLGHYEILEVVGTGGMGMVLKAFDENLHRVVAIKVMAESLAASASARKRFVREARAGAAVRHDNMVDIHAVEEAGGRPYLVMEFISGISLQQRLDQSAALRVREILRIGMQIAQGLAAAHAQGLVHRDIKPANILLENSVERVKITDFGLARVADDASLTQSGLVAGTPQYMAPEQARGEQVDHRADLFSLGSVLYAMCTGHAPFRASTTMAVLKRLCEDTPRPIKQLNPDIPDWLIEIIDRLLAKQRDERFQTAAEVADLLSQHLAQVQHPAAVTQGSRHAPRDVPSKVADTLRVTSPSGDVSPCDRSDRAPNGQTQGHVSRSETATRRRRLWAVAATILVVLLGSLGLSEATGVTRLAATVIRIATGEGTLIVEVNDPEVQVTVEGDGGLSITGAGPREVRVRPGSYRVKAAKDGQPITLERELVTIARGGKEVVKVTLEGHRATGGTVPQAAPPQPFVILGVPGASERKFDNLAEAVLGASGGDTIEVRGNGPFSSQPISITGGALTIRAAEGFRPVIKFQASENEPDDLLFTTAAPLVLEGLELHGSRREEASAKAIPFPTIVNSRRAPLFVANCRFMARNRSAITQNNGANCQIRNCEFRGHGYSSALGIWSTTRMDAGIDNNLIACFGGATFHGGPRPEDVRIRLTRNLVLGMLAWQFAPGIADVSVAAAPEANKPIQVELSGNIAHVACGVQFYLGEADGVEPDEAKTRLQRAFRWQEQQGVVVGLPGQVRGPSSTRGESIGIVQFSDLADWKQFWGLADDAIVGATPRYQRGDLVSRVKAAEKLTPADFRLREGSAGYRAGTDGKDLGADIDLVGPGAAYEHWKKMPEYQEWLKETGQVK